jgi:hypothetical protein
MAVGFRLKSSMDLILALLQIVWVNFDRKWELSIGR